MPSAGSVPGGGSTKLTDSAPVTGDNTGDGGWGQRGVPSKRSNRAVLCPDRHRVARAVHRHVGLEDGVSGPREVGGFGPLVRTRRIPGRDEVCTPAHELPPHDVHVARCVGGHGRGPGGCRLWARHVAGGGPRPADETGHLDRASRQCLVRPCHGDDAGGVDGRSRRRVGAPVHGERKRRRPTDSGRIARGFHHTATRPGGHGVAGVVHGDLGIGRCASGESHRQIVRGAPGARVRVEVRGAHVRASHPHDVRHASGVHHDATEPGRRAHFASRGPRSGRRRVAAARDAGVGVVPAHRGAAGHVHRDERTCLERPRRNGLELPPPRCPVVAIRLEDIPSQGDVEPGGDRVAESVDRQIPGLVL